MGRAERISVKSIVIGILLTMLPERKAKMPIVKRLLFWTMETIESITPIDFKVEIRTDIPSKKGMSS